MLLTVYHLVDERGMKRFKDCLQYQIRLIFCQPVNPPLQIHLRL
jgi:hypothetical protein